MRVLLLLLALCSFVGAAEMEYIKLKDGRTFTGLYDEDAGTIEITTGTAKAKIPIKTDEIATREPIAAKAPERDFVAEAQRLHDKEAAEEKAKAEALKKLDEEVARQKAIREKQAADAAAVAQWELERDDRIRQIKMEGADAEHRAAVASALHDAEVAEQQRKEKSLADAKRAAEQAERDRLHAIAGEAQRNQFAKALEEMADRERRQQIAAQEMERQRHAEETRRMWEGIGAGLMIGAFFVFVFLMWLLPVVLAYRRRFAKRTDVTILLGATCIAAVLCSMLAGFPVNVIGCSVGALGWLGSLVWVLIASAPPKTDA